MSQVMNKDVVVLAHITMKHTQQEAKNCNLYMEAQSAIQQTKEVRTCINCRPKYVLHVLLSFQLKREEFRLKAKVTALEDEHRKLVENAGLLGNKALIHDYSSTLYNMDRTQRRIELEVPLTAEKREHLKVSKMF